MLYFDHSATTPPYDEVAESMIEVMKGYFGNPSSIHRVGLDAERLVTKARTLIARSLGVQASEIVFTSGGTESNNLAIKGTTAEYSGRGKHIVSTELEHPSVYETCRQLQAAGYEVTFLKPGENGCITPEDVQKAIRKDTCLVSVMQVNNEVGTIQPILEIGQLLKDYPRILFHVDAVQGFAKIPILPAQWGIDLMSASAHKLRGPKGIGFLYRRQGVRLQPLLAGGGQEQGVRSGTENVPAIVGMAKAVRLNMEGRAAAEKHMRGLRSRLLSQLADVPSIIRSGSAAIELSAPHIVHFTVAGIRSEVLVHAMEKEHCIISSKSACASGEIEPSRVLLAMGMDPVRASSGIRISFSA
ncbi:MAG: iscS1, partial [Paenibacillus sp.]|nr:iscS1 [Paenibacillus sp.]